MTLSFAVARGLLAAGLAAAALAAGFAKFCSLSASPLAPPASLGPAPADATPAAAEAWRQRVAATRAGLPSARAFEAWRRAREGGWTSQILEAERLSGCEIRRYRWSWEHPTFQAWPEILRSVQDLCAEPGVNIDRLALVAEPDGSEAFQEAGITLTVRILL